MGDVIKFTPAKLDGNVWYHVTEGRVDDYNKKEFSNMFQILSGSGALAVFGDVEPAQYWQFQPLDKAGRYAVRNIKAGVSKQLSVCYNANETDDSRTQPCMARSSGGDEQKWDIAGWGDKTFRFINVMNGTDYWLDVHKGNPMFMSNNIDTKVYQSAQHWLMTSASDVNEGAFSTVFTDNPSVSTVTSASSTHTVITNDPSKETNSSGGGGLSSGAAAGIGVGVALVVIGLLVGAFLWWRRRQRASAGSAPVELGDAGVYSSTPQEKKHEHYGNQQHQYQAAAQSPPPQELPNDTAPVEVPGDTHYGVNDATQHGR